MIRLLFILILGALAVVCALVAIRMIWESRVDWRGLALMAGFVAVAILAHQKTGIGGLVSL